MTRLSRLLIVAALAVVVAACGTSKPVLNIDDAPIAGTHTTDQVRMVIATVAKKRGWVVEDVGPGLLKATFSGHSHRAVVNIPYTTTTFSIHYVDGTNLDYNGKTIHRNYDRWINNLREDIQKELAGIPVT